MNTTEIGVSLISHGVLMSLKGFGKKNLDLLKGRRRRLDRNTKGPQVYVAFNRRLKKFYVGVTKNSFNERYARRDYKHHFSNAFYCDPCAFDIIIFKVKTMKLAYKLEERLVGWSEAKSDKYYNKIPGGNNE